MFFRSCANDYVLVIDGHTGDGETLGRFCGLEQPSTTVSSGNEMTVRLRTDAFAAGDGFKAQYSIGT